MVKKEERIQRRLKEEIRKDGKNNTYAAKGMAKISFEDKTIEWKKEYGKEEFNRRVSNYKSSIRKYDSGENVDQKSKVLKFLQQAMNWSDERLQFALSPREGTGDLVNYQSDPELSEIELEYLKQGWEYIALETYTEAIYADNSILELSKTIKLKSLVDNLEKTKEIVYLRIIREDEVNQKGYEFNYFPKSLVEVRKIQDKNNIIYHILHFIKPLGKGEEITINFYHKLEQVIAQDRTCHYTQFLCPTIYGRLTVKPPSYVQKGDEAEVRESQRDKDFQLITRDIGNFSRKIILSESGNYECEFHNPTIYDGYLIYWGKEKVE